MENDWRLSRVLFHFVCIDLQVGKESNSFLIDVYY
jgi:hypothetical protein